MWVEDCTCAGCRPYVRCCTGADYFQTMMFVACFTPRRRQACANSCINQDFPDVGVYLILFSARSRAQRSNLFVLLFELAKSSRMSTRHKTVGDLPSGLPGNQQVTSVRAPRGLLEPQSFRIRDPLWSL